MGLHLSVTKTLITHIDDFDFLGWRIQRHRRKGGTRRFVYNYPSKTAMASITGKIKTICRRPAIVKLWSDEANLHKSA